MNVSPEFEKLIEATFLDGKITNKEKEVLCKRAEKEGIDLDEFEIFLTSKFHIFALEQDKGTVVTETGEVVEYSKKGQRNLMFTILIVFVLLFCGGGILMYFSSRNSNKVEDFIAKYDFVNARKEVSELPCREEGNSWDGKFSCPRTENLLKIIVSESEFLSNNQEFDRAISVISEINGLEKYSQLLENGTFSKTQDEMISDLVSKVVLKASNYPEKISLEKLKVYLGYIKDQNEVSRLKDILKIN